MRRLQTLTGVLGCMALGCSAAVPMDFARGRVIDVDAAQVVLRVTVPQDVYEWVTRPDLGDLRVFNGAHQEVPYSLRRPTGLQEFSVWIDVPIFELPDAPNGSREGARVSVQVDDGGAVVSVNGGAVQPTESASLLVDCSAVEREISELLVTWPTDASGFLSKYRVDVSDDLDSWKTVVSSATLARLETDGQQVTADVIKLPGTRARYLKLEPLEGSAGAPISAVQVRSRLARLPERQWQTLHGRPTGVGYEFEIDGYVPLDRVSIELEQDTYLVVASLYSKARAKDSWGGRGAHTFYRVAANGTSVSAEPIVQSSRDRYWRVELAGDDTRVPLLKFGWLPDEIVFLRQGSEPFLLAYGRAGLAGSPWPMRDLLSRLGADRDIDSIAPAGLRAPDNLGGPSRLVPAPEPLDWQTIVLWVVLIAGVGVIALFAYRLLKAPAES